MLAERRVPASYDLQGVSRRISRVLRFIWCRRRFGIPTSPQQAATCTCGRKEQRRLFGGEAAKAATSVGREADNRRMEPDEVLKSLQVGLARIKETRAALDRERAPRFSAFEAMLPGETGCPECSGSSSTTTPRTVRGQRSYISFLT